MSANNLDEACIDCMYQAALAHVHATHSPLLRLSAELRDHTFKHVFSDVKVHIGRDNATDQPLPVVRVLVTCRQIYVEARNQLSISESEFSSHQVESGFRDLHAFAQDQWNKITMARTFIEVSSTTHLTEITNGAVASLKLLPSLERPVVIMNPEMPAWSYHDLWERMRRYIEARIKGALKNVEVVVLTATEVTHLV